MVFKTELLLIVVNFSEDYAFCLLQRNCLRHFESRRHLSEFEKIQVCLA
jgi:hypothetical protein